MSQAKSAEKVVQEIRRKTRRQFSAEEKIRIVLEGLRGEESITALWWTLGIQRLLLVGVPVLVLASSAGVWLFYVQHQFEGRCAKPS